MNSTTLTLTSPAFWLALLLLSVVSFPVYAQAVGARVGPQFPLLTTSARSVAMGDASSALLDDFSGFGSNPGALGFLRKSSVDYTTQRIQKGITLEHIGLAYKTTATDAIAFGVDVLHFGGTDFYTDANVRNLGYELRTGFAYGRKLGESLSMGINFQVLMTTTGPTSVWAFGGDLGLSYAPEKYIRYGFFIKGISSEYRITAPIIRTDVFTSRIPRVMGLGVAIDFPFDSRSKRIVVALQNEKVFGERDLIYRMGVEYFPIWSQGFRFAVRGGLLARDPDTQPRLGLGIGFSDFSLDYAYGYIRRYSQPTQTFNLSFAW